jgi:hypothetical protein
MQQAPDTSGRPALDVAASVAFYRRMGFELIVDSPHYARFKSTVSDATFSLHAVQADATVKSMLPVGMIVSVHWLPRREHAMFAGHVGAALATVAGNP